MDKRKKYKSILKAFTSEEIQLYAESLEDGELHEFIEALDRSNMGLEEAVGKKITAVKYKKSNLGLVLRRVWLHLPEEDRKGLAVFFEDIHRLSNI